MQKATPKGRGWMCPNEAWEILIERVPRRSVPEDLLRFCFAKRREITVRNGEVRTSFWSKEYHYRMAGSHLQLMAFNGRKVQLAYDPLDLGEADIYCESRFIGRASCIELRRMGEDAFVADERGRRAARRAVKNFIAVVHESVPVADADTRIERRKGLLPERTEATRPDEPLTVPLAISEAAEAARAEREFNHAQVEIAVPFTPPPVADADDGEFRFFSSGGGN